MFTFLYYIVNNFPRLSEIITVYFKFILVIVSFSFSLVRDILVSKLLIFVL